MRSARPFLCSLALILVLIVPTSGRAQQWSGIISPNRAVDWTTAGVEGGIPNRQTNCVTSACNTLFGGTVTAASINAALASAPANTVVRIPAGTFTGLGGISFTQSNITLRGAGADQTKLIFTGTVSNCHEFYNEVIAMCTGNGSGNIGNFNVDNSANWTAGYTQGTTVVTLDSVANLAVGSTLFLDQNNDASDGYPAAGDIFVCSTTSSNCSNEGGGDNLARSGRAQTELHKVTAINGLNVTIAPAIYQVNFRSSQAPGAWWGNSNTPLQNSGVENMSIDFTGGGQVGIAMINDTNDWVKGCRLLFVGGPGSFVFHVLLINGFHVTLQDNYIFGPIVQGNTQYQITPHVSGLLLIQNNILDTVVEGVAPNGPFSGSVISYNFVQGSFYTGPGVLLHNGGEAMNLYEGNTMSGFMGDIKHGTHHFDTLFRNHLNGNVSNPPANINSIVMLQTHNRFFNVVGNVLGDPTYITSYQSLQAQNDNTIYNLGWQGNGSGTAVTNDPDVPRTLMRWGNYDSFTGTVRFVSAEVPSGIKSFANPVPASQTLPASFYLNSKPAWFGSVPWPAIGPDVTGGSAAGYAGHANKTPARLCWEGAANDSGYAPGKTSTGSPYNVKVFNANKCYAAGAVVAPPTNLSLVVN